MKRDFELVRLLLLELEGETLMDLSPYTDEQKNYHRALLIEGGLAEGLVHCPSTHATNIPDDVYLKRLTWEGHEFLDKARTDTVWDRAKATVRKKGLEFSLDVLKIALSEAVKTMLK